MRQKILNSKSRKLILSMLEERFAFNKETLQDYVFIQSGDRIYITNRELELLPLKDLRIDNIGLYLASIEPKFNHAKIRLSIEGSQIVGKTAKKNVLSINREDMKSWILGKDIQVENVDYNSNCEPGFIILKFHDNFDHFLGCGLMTNEGVVKNYIPKERRLKKFFDLSDKPNG